MSVFLNIIICWEKNKFLKDRNKLKYLKLKNLLLIINTASC